MDVFTKGLSRCRGAPAPTCGSARIERKLSDLRELIDSTADDIETEEDAAELARLAGELGDARERIGLYKGLAVLAERRGVKLAEDVLEAVTASDYTAKRERDERELTAEREKLQREAHCPVVETENVTKETEALPPLVDFVNA